MHNHTSAHKYGHTAHKHQDTQTDTKGSGVAAGRESEGEGLKGAHADQRVGRDGVLEEDAHQVLAHPPPRPAAAISPALGLNGIPKVPPTPLALPLRPPRVPRRGEGGGTAGLDGLDSAQSSSTNQRVPVAQRMPGQDQGAVVVVRRHAAHGPQRRRPQVLVV